jgi:hypothetical protein
MRIRQTIATLAILLGALGVNAANAGVYVVDAFNNSSTGGTGLATLSLTAGESFSISSSTNDLWSLGGLPRFSDGNGLVGNRFATASDDSGWSPGTQIGADFGLWTQHGVSLPYGSLVGEIGGVYEELGANFSGTAWNTGVLNLYTWDENNYDNFGSITFDVSAASVPEPITLSLFGTGLAGAVAMRRRRKQTA